MGVLNTAQQLLAALAICTSVQASSEILLPGYGRFQGTTIRETISSKPLPVAVDAWLGIDYASQPVGQARFSPVGPPAAFDGVKKATQYGYTCVQDAKSTPWEQHEACLSMNVFRPQGVSEHAKLPVLIWIYGGAFQQGSSRSFDGPSFIAHAKEPVMVVTFNYRVGSLGFLPSLTFERLGLLNLGLRDQELLLKFVQKYISAFGGDPRRVTLGGRSAGAHSVGIHLFHNYNKAAGPSPLFSQAILQSGSVTARTFPNASFPMYQKQFTHFLDLVGCGADVKSSDTKILACLRAASVSVIQKASEDVYDASKYSITWPFQPTLGGPLLEHRGSAAGVNGQFYSIPVITSNVPDEAKFYSPLGISTNAEYLAFLKTLIPGLNAADLVDLTSLYSDPTKDPHSEFAHSPVSPQYNRISAALSDYMYLCPGQETAVRMSPSSPVFKLNFAVNNSFPAYQGIPHTADTAYTWAEPTVSNRGLQYPEMGRLLHGYLANFVVAGDPNKGTNTQGTAAHVPVWPRYVDANGKPGSQLKLEPSGGSNVESDLRRRAQCEWWRSPARAPRLEK